MYYETWKALSDTAKAVIAVFLAGLLIGAIVLGWVFVLGPLFNQASYNNFNNSPEHLNAVATKFTDDCTQLAETSDPIARKAIEQDIAQVAATVDVDKVQMPDAVRSCVNKAISDTTGG